MAARPSFQEWLSATIGTQDPDEQYFDRLSNADFGHFIQNNAAFLQGFIQYLNNDSMEEYTQALDTVLHTHPNNLGQNLAVVDPTNHTQGYFVYPLLHDLLDDHRASLETYYTNLQLPPPQNPPFVPRSSERLAFASGRQQEQPRLYALPLRGTQDQDPITLTREMGPTITLSMGDIVGYSGAIGRLETLRRDPAALTPATRRPYTAQDIEAMRTFVNDFRGGFYQRHRRKKGTRRRTRRTKRTRRKRRKYTLI